VGPFRLWLSRWVLLLRLLELVLLTQNSSKPTDSETQAAENEFLAALKPVLSNESLTALREP
jgi:hypothetical protein